MVRRAARGKPTGPTFGRAAGEANSFLTLHTLNAFQVLMPFQFSDNFPSFNAQPKLSLGENK